EVRGRVHVRDEIDEPPHHHRLRELVIRPRLQREADDLRVDVPLTQLLDETVGEDLGAAADERHLRAAHGDSRRSRARATRLDDAHGRGMLRDISVSHDARARPPALPCVRRFSVTRPRPPIALPSAARKKFWTMNTQLKWAP